MRSPETAQTRVVPAFLLLSAASVAGIWTVDLIKGEKAQRPAGVLSLRDRDTQENLVPHLIAEYATAGALVAGAVGLVMRARWGRPAAGASLGALTYTSVNSLSWVVSRRERLPYGLPMVATLTGSVASFAILFRDEAGGSRRGDTAAGRDR